MKKITSILASMLLITTVPILSISCTFRKWTSGHDGVINAPDYDWSKTNAYDLNARETQRLNEIKENNVIQNVSPTNLGNTLNWNNLSTGYRSFDQIKMQSATGVPIENTYNLTGNVQSDFGFSGMSSNFTTINDILSWNPKNDADAKYSKSTTPLQQREAVGQKWTSTQNQNIKFMNMGRQYSGRYNGVDGNLTITGQQNIFQQSFNSWQYVDSYVWWRGMVGVPPGEFTDYAHTNGSKSFGLLYLDGFFGLKPGMLIDLMKKDDKTGQYLIVDKLLEMAKYYGFDGWFVNEEANGAFSESQPILNKKVMIDILSQFKEKAKGSGIEIISYTDTGTLAYDGNDENPAPLNNKSVLYANNSNGYLTDFGDKATSNIFYTNINQEKSKIVDLNSLTYDQNKNVNFDIYNMWDWGSVRDGAGKYFCAPSRNVYWDGLSLDENDNKAINSIAMFGAQAGWENANDYFSPQAGSDDLVGQKIQRMQYQDSEESGLYVGKDRNLTNSWYEKAIDNLNPSKPNGATAQRSDFKDKSFGVANLVQEKTTIINGIKNFKTSFSTGQGKKWVDINHQELNSLDGYTWYNRSLGDVQPTYKWDISKLENNASEFKPIIKGDDNQISGFYDYDQVFEKGNSLALGKEFYNSSEHKYLAGQIMDSSFKNKTNYNWNFLGANLTLDTNYNISIIYKISQNNTTNDVTKLIQKNNVKMLLNSNSELEATNSELENGWSKLDFTLNPSKLTDQGLFKIGLMITNLESNTNFKLNVGQVNIDQINEIKPSIEDVSIIDFSSEYTIIRDKNHTINIRMNWDTNANEQVKYFEVYYELNGKVYRYGETANDCYWIGDINLGDDYYNVKSFKIMIRPISDNSLNDKYTTINLNIERGGQNEINSNK